jgi:hypothetical protein
MTGAPRQARSTPDSAKARQSLRLPGSGVPIATTKWLLASMTTCRLVEYRWFLLEAAMLRSRVGTRVPSTI